ncbi:O-antigen ligase [Povalibacter uvarum]|uniref:O-antigen ligase n=1 Tax=Povalibacter uvarum TaxID=732238 RepID=A0A841HGE2_9GAMM|nr:O-antigen ligase family protein [Povalibacter uvarum]MBB6091634.1 O-antigen ligase [Povalibacter uvarum]
MATTTNPIPSSYPTLSLPQIVVFNLLIFVWWLEVGLRVSFLGTIRFEFLLAATATAMAIMRMQSRSRAPQRKRKVDDNSDITRVIIIFIVVLTLSLPLAIDFNIAWFNFFNRVAKLALIGVLISQFVVSPHTLRIYLLTSLAAFMKIGQEGFLGKITGNMVWENQGVPRLHGTAGTMFGHPNSLSGKIVSLVPWVWYLYPVIQNRWVKILIAIQLVFVINIVVFTASRTGYMTAIVAAFLIIMFSGKKKMRLIMIFIGASILTVAVFPQEYKERFMSSFTGVEAEGASSATRKGLFFDSLGAFADNPLGVGIACFPTYQAMHDRNAQDTHNLYTQVLAETGIQGFLCFIALVIVVLRKAFRCRRSFSAIVERLERHSAAGPPGSNQLAGSNELATSELGDARLMLATTNALIVYTLVRLVLGVFGHDFLEIYWWLAAGLVMALNNMRIVAEQRCDELAAIAPGAVPAQRAPSRAVFNRPRYGQQ